MSTNVLVKSLAILGVAILCSPGAHATTYQVTDMEVNPGSPYVTLNVGAITPSDPSAIAGLIELTTTTSDVLPVFCIDIYHDFIIGPQSPNLTYVTAPIVNDSSGTFSGQGVPLTAKQIGAMQSVADLGFSQFQTNSPNLTDNLVADQGAIWAIEYGKAVTSTDATIDGLIGTAEAYGEGHPVLPGMGLYELGNEDHFGSSQGFIQGGPTPGVPEASTWMMLLVGFLGLAGMGVRKHARVQL